jgi:hypothetical protein
MLRKQIENYYLKTCAFNILSIKFSILENPSISTITGGYNSRSSKGVLVYSCNGLGYRLNFIQRKYYDYMIR